MAILWDENLRTGIDEIDEQHKKLFRLVGKFEKIKRSKNMFIEALNEVDEYVKVHFDTEEKYMQKYNYPDYEAHKVVHNKFKMDYRQFSKKAVASANISEIATELTEFVESWIKEHYTNEDVRMAVFLKNNQ